MNDNSTDMMLKSIQKSKKVKWTTDQLNAISSGYKTSLEEGRIQILNEKLVFYEPILPNHRYVALIIVSQSLRRSIFSYFHYRPSEGHMG